MQYYAEKETESYYDDDEQKIGLWQERKEISVDAHG